MTAGKPRVTFWDKWKEQNPNKYKALTWVREIIHDKRNKRKPRRTERI